MKELIRYLIPLVIGGAVLIYLDVWPRSITPIEDPSLKDAPYAGAVATTPAVKSGYQYGGPPSAMATGPSYFATAEPPKVSALPKSSLYYGACGPNLLHVTFAPGAQIAAKQVLGIDVVLHFLDDQGVEFAKSSSAMTPIGGAGDLQSAYDILIPFSPGVEAAPLTGPMLPNLGAFSHPSIFLSFVLHFAGSPDQELWWQLNDSGDEVLVAFEFGDVHRPVVISVYPCPQEIPATPTPQENREKEGEGAPCTRRDCP
jgi:hypothetical protein